MLLERYPQKITLKDGTDLLLKAMNKQDERALMDFFEGLEEADRLYLRNDVSSYRVVREWFKSLNYNRVFPLLAVHGDRIVANATLHRKPFGWMRHVGEIRIVVSPDFRKRGLAHTMFTELIHTAAGMDRDVLPRILDDAIHPLQLRVDELAPEGIAHLQAVLLSPVVA